MAAGSVQGYESAARRFLSNRARGGELELEELVAADITRFVQGECRDGHVRGAKILVSALRSLLHYLHLEGRTARQLPSVVPAVAGWRASSLPRGLEPEQVARLLAIQEDSSSRSRRSWGPRLKSGLWSSTSPPRATRSDLPDCRWHAERRSTELERESQQSLARRWCADERSAPPRRVRKGSTPCHATAAEPERVLVNLSSDPPLAPCSSTTGRPLQTRLLTQVMDFDAPAAVRLPNRLSSSRHLGKRHTSAALAWPRQPFGK